MESLNQKLLGQDIELYLNNSYGNLEYMASV